MELTLTSTETCTTPASSRHHQHHGSNRHHHHPNKAVFFSLSAFLVLTLQAVYLTKAEIAHPDFFSNLKMFKNNNNNSRNFTPLGTFTSSSRNFDRDICDLSNVIDTHPNLNTPFTTTDTDNNTSSNNLTQLVIGYLPIENTCDEKFLVNRQFRVISGALTYAIEEMNRQEVVPGHELTFVWNDTHGSIAGNLRVITDMWQRGVDMFLGPEETCSHEGRVAAAWNLPMLSYKCADDEVSDKKKYPTFARTRPPAAQVTTSILSLLLHFNWTRFSLVAGSSHGPTRVATKLLQLSKVHNLTVNHHKEFKEPYTSFMPGNPFPEIVQETYVETRVYVFLGQLNGMVDMMTNLNDRGLLMTGNYVLVFVEHPSRTAYINPLKYFKRTFDNEGTIRFQHGEQSLLVIKPTAVASTTNTSLFHQKVIHYNAQPPFQFPNPLNIPKMIAYYAAYLQNSLILCLEAVAKVLRDMLTSETITDYAAYLYDAITLYAEAAAEVLKDGGNVRNGTAIINKIRGRAYKSILGYKTRIDENGDAAGHFSLLAFKQYEKYYTMSPVAQFDMNGFKDRPTFKMFPGEQIHWMAGAPPIAEPPCGYHLERCIPPQTFVKEIALGVLGGVVLVTAVVALVVYRNWRYEQEIDGLLWKIESSQLQMTHGYTGLAGDTDKQRQDGGGGVSMVSAESRNSYTQVFAQTGIYNRQTVALKLYDKPNVDLGRNTKKEMKLLRDLRHNNINTFIGASVDSGYLVLVTEYCAKGSLTDVLDNEDISLDEMFISSLVKDLIQGMIFLHDSELQHHGGLKSSNCLITSRWTLQVGDFGLLDTRSLTYKPEDLYAYYRNLLWKAPELLRSSKPHRGSPKGDTYSFGIILYEMFGRAGPFGHCKLSPKEIVESVKKEVLAETNPFRPETDWLTCSHYVISCIQDCWAESPEQRPDFKTIWHTLKPMRSGMKRNIFDHMMSMMEKYQERLEEKVEERTLQLQEEKKKTETLLLRMLPRTVADQLKRGEAVIPESFDSVTIYFSDICGFTKLSAESNPMEVVDMLNDLYTAFDSIVHHYDVYKVETIGDAYMVVSGLPLRNGDDHAGEVASMSLALLTAIQTFDVRHKPSETLKLRVGIHSGSCVAGVVGLTMPRYTLFGDTVNTASRMETNGEPLKVHCSKECKAILDKLGGYSLDERGFVTMKGKGDVLTYWLTGENAEVRMARLRRSDRSHLIPVGSDLTTTTMGSSSCSSSTLLLQPQQQPPQPLQPPHSPFTSGCRSAAAGGAPSACFRPVAHSFTHSRTHSPHRHSPHSHSPHSHSPSHSPMLNNSRLSRGSRVRLADSAATKDSESVRGVSGGGGSGNFSGGGSLRGGGGGGGGSGGDFVNGVSQFRGRLHSFKDVFSKTRSRLTPTNSEPVIHGGSLSFKNSHLAVPEVVGSAPNEKTLSLTPKLKGRRRGGDNNSHCVSIYDNATPTELSVLLGDGTCAASLDEERDGAESSFSKDNSPPVYHL